MRADVGAHRRVRATYVHDGTMLLSFQLPSEKEAIRSAALEWAEHMANGWLPADDSDAE